MISIVIIIVIVVIIIVVIIVIIVIVIGIVIIIIIATIFGAWIYFKSLDFAWEALQKLHIDGPNTAPRWPRDGPTNGAKVAPR